MNAYQSAYAKALAIMELSREKRDEYEASFFKNKGLTLREAIKRADVMDEYDNDETASVLECAYTDAVVLRAEAAQSLVEWGLSIMPIGLEKELRKAANRHKYRERLIDILMKLDTKCGDTAITEQLETLYKSA